MSTVHKHFPITSHPGTSWGQGPQVVFHVSNPLWGNRRKGKDGGEGLRIKYAIWEENLSKFSCADCFFFCTEAVGNLLLLFVMVEMTAGCPSSPFLQHICHYLHNGWWVIWVPLQQASSGLSGPSANYTLRTWEEPITRVPLWIDADQQVVSCLVGCQTCWGWCPCTDTLVKWPLICEILET